MAIGFALVPSLRSHHMFGGINTNYTYLLVQPEFLYRLKSGSRSELRVLRLTGIQGPWNRTRNGVSRWSHRRLVAYRLAQRQSYGDCLYTSSLERSRVIETECNSVWMNEVEERRRDTKSGNDATRIDHVTEWEKSFWTRVLRCIFISLFETMSRSYDRGKVATHIGWTRSHIFLSQSSHRFLSRRPLVPGKLPCISPATCITN